MTDLSTFENSFSNIPVLDIGERWISQAGIRLMIKREDLIHPEISGNKWRKLKYNLIEAGKQHFSTLLTFGGAYSNHIYATAAAGKETGFKTIGIIRGEAPKTLNPTLQFAKECGMQLHFVSRTAYRDKKAILSQIPLDLKSVYILPEGGTNGLALKGCSEIVTTFDSASNIDYWCVSCGTGGTVAGIITALPTDQKAVGFSALKGEFLKTEVEKLLLDFTDKKHQNWSINTNYHFGGYAKFDKTLIHFINEFKRKNQIQLDPIYTGKMFFGIYELIKKGYFPRGSTIMAVHTGGQQGILGFNQRFGNLLEQ
jgi:1-aminocyclopropane-1-carboxylate deaminase/D-cysteine desulfhydrase-like pyridoxal-dependent ACC family enzyme